MTENDKLAPPKWVQMIPEADPRAPMLTASYTPQNACSVEFDAATERRMLRYLEPDGAVAFVRLKPRFAPAPQEDVMVWEGGDNRLHNCRVEPGDWDWGAGSEVCGGHSDSYDKAVARIWDTNEVIQVLKRRAAGGLPEPETLRRTPEDFIGDTCGSHYAPAAGIYYRWVLYNGKPDVAYQTDADHNGIGGRTVWLEQTSRDGITGWRDNCIRLCDCEKSLATGSVLPFNGRLHYFYTIYEKDTQAIGHAVASDFGKPVVYQEPVLADASQAKFRDPYCFMLGGRAVMLAAADKGLRVYTSNDPDLQKWERASDFAFSGYPECFNFLPFNSKSFLIFGNQDKDGVPTTMAQEGFFSADYHWTATGEPYPIDYGNSVYGASLGRVGNGWVLHSSNLNWNFTPAMPHHWRTACSRQLQVVNNRLTIDMPADTGAGLAPNHQAYGDLTLRQDYSLPIREMAWGAVIDLFIDAPTERGTALRLSSGGAAALVLEQVEGGFSLKAADFGAHPLRNIYDYNKPSFLPADVSKNCSIRVAVDAGGEWVQVAVNGVSATRKIILPLGALRVGLHCPYEVDPNDPAKITREAVYPGRADYYYRGLMRLSGGLTQAEADGRYMSVSIFPVQSFSNNDEERVVQLTHEKNDRTLRFRTKFGQKAVDAINITDTPADDRFVIHNIGLDKDGKPVEGDANIALKAIGVNKESGIWFGLDADGKNIPVQGAPGKQGVSVFSVQCNDLGDSFNFTVKFSDGLSKDTNKIAKKAGKSGADGVNGKDGVITGISLVSAAFNAAPAAESVGFSDKLRGGENA